MKKLLSLCSLLLLSSAFVFAQQPKPTLAVDIIPGADPSNPENIVAFNGKLYFAMNDSNFDQELWSYNGVNAPTRVADINPGSANWSSPTDLIVFKNKLYFRADDGVHGPELWVYDGTNPPSMVMDIYPGSIPGLPKEFCIFNDVLYFQAGDDTHGAELWKYDGVNAPTMVADIYSGATGSAPFFITVFNNAIYFEAEDATNGYELWKYTGTGVPTLAADIVPGAGSGFPGGLKVFNNNLYFKADDGTNGSELWKYDGTNAPTMVADIYPGSGSGSPVFLTVFKNKLYFQADNAVNGQELWVYDGTNAPSLVYDINTNSTNGSFPEQMFVYGDTLYFGANDEVSGMEIWKYSGSGNAQLLKDLYPGIDGAFMKSPVLYNGKMYFGANDGTHGTELFYISNCASYSNINASGCNSYVSPSTKYTWTVTGVYKDTLVNAVNCDSIITINLTINAKPTVSINSVTICSGTTATLTATPSAGGGTYLWDNNATTQSITVSQANTTTYMVFYTRNGCTSDVAHGTVTINSLPTITLGSNPQICQGVTTANLPYSATSGSPNQYSIDFNPNAEANGFVDVVNASLPASPLSIVVPGAAPAAAYSAMLTVKNSSTGCSSSTNTITVTINALPTITLGSNPTVCSGTTTANLSYSATSGSPNQYSIDYNPNAEANGFTDVSNTTLSGSPLSLTVPVNAPAGIYSAILAVKNSTSGCSSATNNITVTVNGLPTITLGSNPEVCSGVTTANLSYTATSGTPSQYSIDYDATAELNGFTDVSNTTLSGSPLSLVVPVNAPAGIYSAILAVKNSTTGCSSTTNTITVTVNAIPTVSLVANSLTVCVGHRAILKAVPNITGGDFAWSTGNADPTLDSIIQYPLNDESFSVKYTLNGCTSNTVLGTVITNTNIPTVSFSTASICAGETVTLTPTPSVAGGAYYWSTGETTSTIVVQPESNEEPYTLLYTHNGCVSKIDTAKIYFKTKLDIVTNNVTATCPYQPLVLTVSPETAGGTYLWNTGQTTASITVKPQATTSYTVEYTYFGCKSDKVKVTAFVNPAPYVAVNNESIVLNASAVLTAIPIEEGGTYKWLPNNQTTSSIRVSPTATTTYSVVYTLNSCSDTVSGTVNIVTSTVNPNIVTNTNDSGPGSLRHVIANANNGAVITFASNVTDTIKLTSGEISINKNLTINGPGADVLAIGGNNSSRVFNINIYKVAITINNLTLANGKAVSDNGGAIYNRSNLSLNNCILKNNAANWGGAILNYGVLSINNCILTGNSCTGGGIFGGGGTYGGAIFSSGGLTITHSEVSNNTVYNTIGGRSEGGAIYIEVGGSECKISNSTFYNNIAKGNAPTAGAIMNANKLLVENSTISSNKAIGNQKADGGAIFIWNGSKLTLKNSTFSDNSIDAPTAQGTGVHMSYSSTLNVENTIINNNSVYKTSMGTVQSNGGNICSDNSLVSSLTAAGDKNNTNPKLLPLAFIGGLTKTHALQPGSPAIDAAVSTSLSPATDQRGYCRNGATDVGAFEYNGGISQTFTQKVEAPGQYVWNSTTYTVSGTYSYTTSNGGDCYDTYVLNLNINPFPKLSPRFLSETSSGACDGYAEIGVVGGLSPYTYTWSDIGTTSSFVRKNMCAGTYTVTVTDAKNNTATAVGTLDAVTAATANATELNLNVTSANVSDPLKCDGSATVLATGGTPTYTISFSNDNVVGTSMSLTELCTGFYSVNVKDAAGNKKSSTFVLASLATTYTNSATSTPTSTIVATAVSSCDINYSDIDKISIANAVKVNGMYKVTWRITYKSSSTTNDIIQYYVINSTTGYATVVLDLYCSLRSSEFAKGVDYLQLETITDGSPSTTSIEGLTFGNINIYPNPFDNKINVEVNDASQIILSDVTGKTIVALTINAGTTSIETSGLSAGVYLVTIKNQYGSTVNKLIKN
jgi:ELWxxDGT repeat protein